MMVGCGAGIGGGHQTAKVADGATRHRKIPIVLDARLKGRPTVGLPLANTTRPMPIAFGIVVKLRFCTSGRPLALRLTNCLAQSLMPHPRFLISGCKYVAAISCAGFSLCSLEHFSWKPLLIGLSLSSVFSEQHHPRATDG
jgi:hypothetical protein